MKTKEEIRRRLIVVEADARLHYPPANVEVNAPLALIQVDLAAESNTLRWVLGLSPFAIGRQYQKSGTLYRTKARTA